MLVVERKVQIAKTRKTGSAKHSKDELRAQNARGCHCWLGQQCCQPCAQTFLSASDGIPAVKQDSVIALRLHLRLNQPETFARHRHESPIRQLTPRGGGERIGLFALAGTNVQPTADICPCDPCADLQAYLYQTSWCLRSGLIRTVCN